MGDFSDDDVDVEDLDVVELEEMDTIDLDDPEEQNDPDIAERIDRFTPPRDDALAILEGHNVVEEKFESMIRSVRMLLIVLTREQLMAEGTLSTWFVQKLLFGRFEVCMSIVKSSVASVGF
ncbi:unnamed protein product [Echinostoma caproni]|uniref:MCM_N domain-containing protein n=1 Tax=Echinostoma caproni TaxID=27848 RepID=A0A183A0J9_9TREM|nr:unnamed protein product [Echinostoma caproni]